MSGQFKSGTVVPRQDLKELVEEIQFSEMGLVADKIAPVVQVSKSSAQYPVLPREAIMKVPDIQRAPDGSFQRGQWEMSSDSYQTYESGYEEDVDLTGALENAEFIDSEAMASQLAVNALKLGNESVVATKLFNETTWAGTALSSNPSSALFTSATDGLVDIVTPMDTSATAAPYAVFDTIYRGILRQKNAMAKSAYSAVMSDDLVSFMVRTTEVMNSVMYTDPVAAMSIERKRQFLADYLEIKNIVPVSAAYDTSGRSLDTVVGKFWSNEYCLLAILSNGSGRLKNAQLLNSLTGHNILQTTSLNLTRMTFVVRWFIVLVSIVVFL